jgi:hypothetical protein
MHGLSHGAASQMEASQMTYYYLTNDKGQMLAKDFKSFTNNYSEAEAFCTWEEANCCNQEEYNNKLNEVSSEDM